MNIVIVVEAYWPKRGAIENNTKCLAEKWKALGHAITIFTGNPQNLKTVEKRPEGVVHRVDFLSDCLRSPNKSITKYRELASRIRECDPDIVFATNHASASAILAAKMLKVPVVYQLVGWGLTCTHGLRLLKPDQKLCHNDRGRLACTKCKYSATSKNLVDANVVNKLRHIKWAAQKTFTDIKKFNNYEKIISSVDFHAWVSSITKENLPKTPGKIIPNGVDTVLFKPQPTRNSARQGKQYEEYILTTSRIHEVKGLEYAVEALSKLPENIKLIIVGNSKLYNSAAKIEQNIHFERLNQAISKNNVTHRVIFKGFIERSKLVKLYGDAIAHITPSIWWEPFGCVVTEALACGTPVVVTNSTGASDLVKDGYNGFVVERKNAEQIADAVKQIMARGTTMRVNARKTAVKHCSFEIVAERYIQVFRKLMQRHES